MIRKIKRRKIEMRRTCRRRRNANKTKRRGGDFEGRNKRKRIIGEKERYVREISEKLKRVHV